MAYLIGCCGKNKLGVSGSYSSSSIMGMSMNHLGSSRGRLAIFQPSTGVRIGKSTHVCSSPFQRLPEA